MTRPRVACRARPAFARSLGLSVAVHLVPGGDRTRATRPGDELAAQGRGGAPSAWPRDTNWLSATKELSEAAWLLGAGELGAELERLLQPFAERIVLAARVMLCMGAVAGALGRLGGTARRLTTAIDRYEQAIEREQRAGATVWATHHRGGWARR